MRGREIQWHSDISDGIILSIIVSYLYEREFLANWQTVLSTTLALFSIKTARNW